MERIIASKTGNSKEILIVLIGSLHGNEKEGVEAINRTFEKLNKEGLPINGKIVGVVGNLQAIGLNQRFIDHDLNRCWTEDYIQKCLSSTESLTYEDKELIALYHLLNDILAQDYQKKFVIDLHTTSADNGNFLVYPGKINDSTIARKLGLPMITNLDDYLEGTTLLQYYSSDEVTSFAFEGGQIGSPKAIDVHSKGIWQLLQLSGIIPNSGFSEKLIESEEALPSLLKVVYRHGVKPDDEFKMKAGFRSFQPVQKGELIATDKNGSILSPGKGLIFMPLYQAAGNDGFFIVEEV